MRIQVRNKKAQAPALIADPRGPYHSYKSMDDICWAVEDILMTLHGVVALQQLMSGKIEKMDRINNMDKELEQVSKKMKKAKAEIKSKPKAAVATLKKAVKKNEKLVQIDKKKIDPMLKKCKAAMKPTQKKIKK
jgi:hypothetical protein